MKARLLKFVALIPLLFLAAASQVSPAHAYTNSHLIDDSVFDNVNSMSAGAVQNFFNANYPNGCLTNYQAPDPQSWSGYGGNVSAAQAIVDAAHIWGINPQVILATLEKEEGLVSGHGAYGCSQTAFNSAMGYDCPGPIQPATGTCVAHTSNLGFSAQVSHGAWQLEFGRYRSEGDGNLAYDGDGAITYYGYMTQGTRPRCSGCASQYYSGTITLSDGTSLYVDNGATAALYSYTPFIQSFSRIFEQFFGTGSTSGQPYAWQFAGQGAYTDATKATPIDLSNVPAGQKATWTVSALNTGPTTWTQGGSNPVHLAANQPNDRTSAFCSTGWQGCSRAASLDQASVASGQTGTFTFSVQMPSTPGVYQEHFNLVSEGVMWLNDPGLYFRVNVVAPTLQGTITSGALPTNMTTSATSAVSLKIRNDGNVTWYNDGNYPIDLGTYNPTDHSSAFATGWLGGGSTRPARLTEASVAPGQTGTFSFNMLAPPNAGSYPEAFSLVAEGEAWFNQPIAQTVAVNGSYNSASTDSPTVNLVAGQSKSVTVHFTNTGTGTWSNTGTNTVRLHTANALDRSSALCDSSWVGSGCNIPATLNETNVAPSGTGSFTFTLKSSPNQNGTYSESFIPEADGLLPFGSPTVVTVNVAPAHYGWSVASQAAFTDSGKGTPLNLSSLSPGQTAWLQLRATNTGNITWTNTGANPIDLGTEGPQDRSSQFATNSWIGSTRPARLIESSVAPGATGTFEFPIQVPNVGGPFFERFGLVAEGVTWMNDLQLSYYINVNHSYSWSLASEYAYTNSSKTTPVSLSMLSPGQTVFIGFTATNTGSSSWYNSGPFAVDLGTIRPTDRNSAFVSSGWVGANRPTRLKEASVAPGAAGTFEFNYTAPTQTGTYLEYFAPVAEGITHFNDIGLNFYSVVR